MRMPEAIEDMRKLYDTALWLAKGDADRAEALLKAYLNGLVDRMIIDSELLKIKREENEETQDQSG